MNMSFGRTAAIGCILAAMGAVQAAADYDLLLQGGHVVDGKNKISAVRDVAIKVGSAVGGLLGCPCAEVTRL